MTKFNRESFDFEEFKNKLLVEMKDEFDKRYVGGGGIHHETKIMDRI